MNFQFFITPVDLDGETFYAVVDAADVRFGTLYPNMLAADTAAVLHFQPATIGGARCPSCGDMSSGICQACREWESDPPGGRVRSRTWGRPARGSSVTIASEWSPSMSARLAALEGQIGL